jgi:Sugar transferases involved in lipopolysaccharide synthesis
MYIDAAERYPELYDYGLVRGVEGFCFHQGNDPRVTRVGKMLRRYSIDEIPNFWNVVRGEMRVVGPRPEIPELARLYGDDLQTLLSVRPGVTSPAKARGRDLLTLDETLACDLAYISNRSFRLDLKTIVETVRTAPRGTGTH